MTFPEEMTVYCTICGAPIYDPSDTRMPHPWLSEATLLHHPPPLPGQPPTQTVLELPAQNNGGPYFTLLAHHTDEAGEGTSEVEIRDVTALDPIPNDDTAERKPLYIPAHTACITLAKRYLRSMRQDVQGGMWRIYGVLHGRFENACETFRVIPFTCLREPNGYYGAARFQGLEWEPGSDLAIAQYFETRPLPLPHLSTSLLAHLHPLPASPTPPLPFQSHLPLPPELSQQILSQLSPLDSPAVESSYILPPWQWREALAAGLVCPWLWDLDAGTLAAKDYEEGGGGRGEVWDWERLVRLLGQREIYKPGGVVEGLEDGVRNRRRIWILVGDLMGGGDGGDGG